MLQTHSGSLWLVLGVHVSTVDRRPISTLQVTSAVPLHEQATPLRVYPPLAASLTRFSLGCGPPVSWSVGTRDILCSISSKSVDSICPFTSTSPPARPPPRPKTPVRRHLRRGAAQASRGSSTSRASSPSLGHGGGAVRIPPAVRRRHRCVRRSLGSPFPSRLLLRLVPSFSLPVPGFLLMPVVRGVGAYSVAGPGGALMRAAFDGNLGRLKGILRAALNSPSLVRSFSRYHSSQGVWASCIAASSH
jgi:hypothetical protein